MSAAVETLMRMDNPMDAVEEHSLILSGGFEAAIAYAEEEDADQSVPDFDGGEMEKVEESPEVIETPPPIPALLPANPPPEEKLAKPIHAEPKLARNYADASQTMKYHLHVALKFVSLMYQQYEDRIKSTNIEDFEKDEQYLQVVMLNSSLLKALHVCESFQAHCVREFPDVSFDFDDPLTSFDGTLTTIYEGEDLSSAGERTALPSEPISVEAHRGMQAECLRLRESHDSTEASLREAQEYVRVLEKAREEERIQACARQQELQDQLEKLELQQKRQLEEVEVAPGVVVTCERDNDTVSITNTELQRFASIMQNLSSAVEIAREQEAASKVKEDQLEQEIADTLQILSDASAPNSTNAPNAVKTNGLKVRNSTLNHQVRSLIEERDRLNAEVRRTKQAASAKNKKDEHVRVLEMKCKDYQLRYENLTQKFVELARRRTTQPTAKRRSASVKKEEVTPTPHRYVFEPRASADTTMSAASLSARTDEETREPSEVDAMRQDRPGARVTRDAPDKIKSSPSEPSLNRPTMGKSLQIPRYRSSSCGRNDATFEKAVRRATSQNPPTQKARSSSFAPPSRTHVTPTPQLTRPPMNLSLRTTSAQLHDATRITKPLAAWPARCSWPGR